MNIINFNFPLDYVLLIIAILFIIFSIWKGLIQSILGLLTWVGSIIITLYSYNAFSNFIDTQLLKIKLFQNYEMISNIISIIISIPVIFLISLFILKKVRKFLSSDLDKQIFGIIIDKVFGVIYGLIFTYFIYSTILFTFNKFNFEDLNQWFTNNSQILRLINNLNEQYIYELIDVIENEDEYIVTIYMETDRNYLFITQTYKGVIIMNKSISVDPCITTINYLYNKMIVSTDHSINNVLNNNDLVKEIGSYIIKNGYTTNL